MIQEVAEKSRSKCQGRKDRISKEGGKEGGWLKEGEEREKEKEGVDKRERIDPKATIQ